MKTLLFTLLCIAPVSVIAQQKAYDIAFSYGGYNSPILYHNQFYDTRNIKAYFSADFDYHLTNRWTISSGFMSGKFGYYDGFSVKLANGTYTDKPNSKGFDLHGYAMAKYAVVAKPRLSLQMGVGVGFYSQRLEYPYEGNTYEAAYAADFEVPISIEGYYFLSGKIGLGLKAGCFVQPEIRGVHIGPQIRLRL
ncbi:hypothetical protein [Spirosoma gilvum]